MITGEQQEKSRDLVNVSLRELRLWSKILGRKLKWYLSLGKAFNRESDLLK